MIKDHLLRRRVATRNGLNITLIPQAPQLIVVPLELQPGDAGSIALVLLKRIQGSNKLAPATCTIDARWSKAKTIIETRLMVDDLLGHEYIKDQTCNVVRTELNEQPYVKTRNIDFCSKGTDNWTYDTIKQDWYNLLSPIIADVVLTSLTTNKLIPNANPTSGSGNNTQSPEDRFLLERLLETSSYPILGAVFDAYEVGWRLKALEVTVSMLFADGLSRLLATLSRHSRGPRF